MFIRLPGPILNSFSIAKTIQINRKANSRLFSSNALSFKNFEDVIKSRQSEASRSIVVQVASEKSYNDVHSVCSQFGNILNAFFYSVPKETSFILLEFENQDAIEEAFRSSAFPDIASGVVPVKSSFLWFRSAANKQKLRQSKDAVKLQISEKIAEKQPSELVNILKGASSISDQIRLLYENTRLNDLSIRLRFLGALQIQRALSGLFLHHFVLPFGSTVNGFGKLGCDLDTILHYNFDDESFNPPKDYDNRRLVFHTKGYPSASKRGMIEKHIKFYGTLCESFIPGASNIAAIHSARVPIVRYNQKYLNISVDISLLNMTGYYISELFHIFGELDDRVRPLVFLVRRWAQEKQITSKTRNYSITNFQLTCIVLSFLQQLENPILPTVPELASKARKIDARHSEDNRSYTFLRDLNEIQFKTQNTDSLEELFVQFLESFGKFDYTKYLISLTSKKPIRKIEPSALQIANPFEMEQNWSRNVTSDECTAFKMQAQDSFADLMVVTSSQRSGDDRWGILTLFPNMK